MSQLCVPTAVALHTMALHTLIFSRLMWITRDSFSGAERTVKDASPFFLNFAISAFIACLHGQPSQCAYRTAALVDETITMACLMLATHRNAVWGMVPWG